MFKQKSEPAAPTLSPADAVQQARTRARRRLVGAIVLLGIGIIGFPLVFETQPRPIPVDIPIEIPRKDSVAPLVAPAPPPSRGINAAPPADASKPEMITESSGDTGRDVTPPPAAASAANLSSARASSTSSGRVAVASASASVAAPATEAPRRAAGASAVATPKTATASSTESDRARALLEGRPLAAAEAQRFVVQVGAFADAEAARGVRQRVEKLGLKTYTQVAQTSGGSRIRVRVGPFTSRDEADAALAKAKAAGIDAVVLTL